MKSQEWTNIEIDTPKQTVTNLLEIENYEYNIIYLSRGYMIGDLWFFSNGVAMGDENRVLRWKKF
jgi:hypothetical protein